MRIGNKSGILIKLASLLTALAFCALFSACGPDPTAAVKEREAEEAMQKTQEQTYKTLRVGVKSTVRGLGFQDVMSGEFSGLEIDLAYLLAQSMGYDSVELMCVHTDERARLLETERLDCVIATYTITETRGKDIDFSVPYYSDYTAVMVGADSEIENMAGLEGKTIAVVQGATTAAALVEEMIKQGLIPEQEYDAAQFDPDTWTHTVTFKVCADDDAANAAMRAGEADAFAMDRSILNDYLRSGDRLLPESFAPQRYGVATAKGSLLSEPINKLIKEWRIDGTLEAMCAKYGI